MTGPTVSFIMPTHGRVSRQPHVIQDAVFWYTQQSYPNTELVILSDVDGQTVTCSVPGVRVYNVPKNTIPSLGYKMNTLMNLAGGEIICPWEDDDLYLPWRAEQAVKMLDGYDFWNPRLWGYHYAGTPIQPDSNGMGHNACCWRRVVMLNAYRNVTSGHDQALVVWAQANLRCNRKPLTDPRDISYVYQWNVSDYHLSGHPDMEDAYRRTPTGAPGTYDVKAVQHTDLMSLYEEMVRNHGQSPSGQ